MAEVCNLILCRAGTSASSLHAAVPYNHIRQYGMTKLDAGHSQAGGIFQLLLELVHMLLIAGSQVDRGQLP